MNQKVANGSRFNRRTILKMTGAGIVGGFAMTGKVTAEHGERETFGTWGSDGTDEWEMLDTGHHPSDPEAHEPIYIIAPSGGCQSPHFNGGLDHVVETPGGGSSYSAEWHIHFVADYSDVEEEGDEPVPATFEEPTISKIDAEVNSKEYLEIVETDGHFTCPVRPAKNIDC